MNRTYLLQMAYVLAYQAVLNKKNVLISNMLVVEAIRTMHTLRETI